MGASAEVDAYIAAQPKDAKAALRRLRTVLHMVIPKADESISYKIPAYHLDGQMILYFAAFRDHYAIYPATAGLKALGKEVTDRIHGKASIHFSYDEDLPTALITRIAKTRVAEAAAHAKAKAAKKKSPAKKTPAKKTTKAKRQSAPRSAKRRGA